jgi:prepilin peptidase CpaA
MNPAQIAAIVVVVLACVPDVWSRRIPNALTFGAAAAAVAFHVATGGWSGVGNSLTGWLVGAVLFFPMFALRGMGAGDVKLLAAVGAWLGPTQVFWVALITSMVGGVLGLIVALAHGYAAKAFRNVITLVMYWRVLGPRPLPSLTIEGTGGPRLAYAIPIAIGTMVTLWLK